MKMHGEVDYLPDRGGGILKNGRTKFIPAPKIRPAEEALPNTNISKVRIHNILRESHKDIFFKHMHRFGQKWPIFFRSKNIWGPKNLPPLPPPFLIFS